MSNKEDTMANVFHKIKVLRKRVGDVYPNLTVQELCAIVQFLANNWHKNKRKKIKLTEQQLTIYELLLKYNYNPTTVYKWLLLATAPEPIKQKVKQNEINIIQALNEKRKHRKYLKTNEKQFITAIIKCVELYISEPSENYPGRLDL